MQVLLDRGADIEATDGISRTPLHMAATTGKVNVVKVCRRSQSLIVLRRAAVDTGSP